MARSKYEIKAQKELEEAHYFVDYKIRPTRVYRGAPVDYWHIFDLLAWKPGELRCISIKGKSCPAKHKNDLQNFLMPPGVSVELWQYNKKGKYGTVTPNRTVFHQGDGD